jgi:hypothetical protein
MGLRAASGIRGNFLIGGSFEGKFIRAEGVFYLAIIGRRIEPP